MREITVGVLALQGAFAKHIEMCHTLGVKAKEVRTPADLADCDALIIPGGESTTIMRLIHTDQFAEPLIEFAEKKPIFGTCAGLILISSSIKNDAMKPFQWLDIEVERNAFGRQIDSFTAQLELTLNNQHYQVPAVFIRAPRICYTAPHVEVLARWNGEPVLVRQGRFLGSTFHPELTDDCSIHAYFLEMV